MVKMAPIVTKNMIRLALTEAGGSVMAAAKALGMDRHKLKQRIESAGLTELVASLKAGNVEQPDAQPDGQQPGEQQTAEQPAEQTLPTEDELAAARKAALAAAVPRRVAPDPRIKHGGFDLGARVLTTRWAVAALLMLGLSACHVEPVPVRVGYPQDLLCDHTARRCLA